MAFLVKSLNLTFSDILIFNISFSFTSNRMVQKISETSVKYYAFWTMLIQVSVHGN